MLVTLTTKSHFFQNLSNTNLFYCILLQLRYQKCLDAHPSAGDRQQGAQQGKVSAPHYMVLCTCIPIYTQIHAYAFIQLNEPIPSHCALYHFQKRRLWPISTKRKQTRIRQQRGPYGYFVLKKYKHLIPDLYG